MPGPVMLLDGASLWFRAFYAVPDSITDADGQPVNAVRGFTDIVAALIKTHKPSRVAVCLDLNWRPQFRVDLIPTYKTHRLAPESDVPGAEEVPDPLLPQVDRIYEVLAAAGIATAGADGLEADDVIGTLASGEAIDPVVVVTGDRDLLQLVRDDEPPIRVYYVGRGLAKAELYGPAEVASKYGVPEANAGDAYADLATLRGDSSDGLPGVAGIGEKTASALMLRWGSIAALQAAAADPASDLSATIRAKILGAADYLAVAPTVTRTVRDADVEFSKYDHLPTVPADLELLRELGTRYNSENAVQRLIDAMAGA